MSAELANGDSGGGRAEAGLGSETGDDRVTENGLAEDDGGMRSARNTGVQRLRLVGVKGERGGEGELCLPVAEKGVEAQAGGDGNDHCDELVAQRDGRVH